MMKTHRSSPVPYAERFTQQSAVAAYESEEYASGSYSSSIWQLQQPRLKEIISRFKTGAHHPVRLLDFACGSGRILSFVEGLVDTAEGVDISTSMSEAAQQRCMSATIRVGDILKEPGLLQPPYDIITSFRFLLNVENPIRRSALHRLREVIRTPGGLLLVNVHGNSRSLRHPAIAWKRWRMRHASATANSEIMLNEMSPLDAKRLLSESGFEVVQMLGFGLAPPTLYRTPIRNMAAALDSFFANRGWLAEQSVDLLFVCRPRMTT
jgi:SAM-dependent methyltransferase